MTDWKKLFPQFLDQKRYSVVRKIGEGGMAVVFQCRDEELDDNVALKILKPELVTSDGMIRQFKQEIKIARRISHRNICRIYDFGSMDDLFFIVMEFLEGVPLSSVIRVKDAISAEKQLPLAIKILQGLEAAHQEKIIHRDLKPGNIMIIKNLEPVITDFGLARSLESSVDETEKSLFGTPAYMSPEQVVGKNVDYRSDLYSFGMILFELLTHRLPYGDDNVFKLLYSHVNDQPIQPRSLNPSIDVNVENIILRCLEKNPEKRYQSATNIISDIMMSYWGKQSTPEKPRRRKVLLADDDPSILKTISRMFIALNFDVIPCNDGQEAVSRAFEELPDLICLDIMMPRMTGLEAAEILLSNTMTKNIPIVIISAKADQEYMVYSRSLGIRDYLTKPIHLADMRQRIDFWLKNTPEP